MKYKRVDLFCVVILGEWSWIFMSEERDKRRNAVSYPKVRRAGMKEEEKKRGKAKKTLGRRPISILTCAHGCTELIGWSRQKVRWLQQKMVQVSAGNPNLYHLTAKVVRENRIAVKSEEVTFGSGSTRQLV